MASRASKKTAPLFRTLSSWTSPCRMTGLESAAEILKEYPKVPIVLLTLYVTKQLEQEARKIGIRATVSKTRMHELADGINQALQGEQLAPPL